MRMYIGEQTGEVRCVPFRVVDLLPKRAHQCTLSHLSGPRFQIV
jgi:hypothetical protein